MCGWCCGAGFAGSVVELGVQVMLRCYVCINTQVIPE